MPRLQAISALVITVGVTLVTTATDKNHAVTVGQEPRTGPRENLSPAEARKAFECLGVKHRQLRDRFHQLDAAVCTLGDLCVEASKASGEDFLVGDMLKQLQQQRTALVDLERKTVQSLREYACHLEQVALPSLQTLARSPPAGWPNEQELRRTLRVAEREMPVYHRSALRFSEDVLPVLSLRLGRIHYPGRSIHRGGKASDRRSRGKGTGLHCRSHAPARPRTPGAQSRTSFRSMAQHNTVLVYRAGSGKMDARRAPPETRSHGSRGTRPDSDDTLGPADEG